MPFWRTSDKTKDILNRYLDHHFYVAAAGANAPSKSDLNALGRRLGCRFPPEFIAHSTGALGGAYIEVKEEFWPRPKIYDVAPFWTFLYALYVFGATPDIPEWMDLERQALKFREERELSLVPCLKLVGDADLYLFTSEGSIVQWEHESNDVRSFDGNFFDLFEREVQQLRDRKDKKLAARDDI